ncbi:MAG: urea carboxylase-associated family protein, partial [Acetobacteraceae bacterium]|nr:urea carboxylase-associated family protein [Acetobacteraceae bacterium]
MSQITIPARRGRAAFVVGGQTVKVINTHGAQVVDTWAFARDDLTEFMSMEHSRAGMLRMIPQVGDTLLTNRRRPILTVLEDTSGGIHDTLIAACDIYRYQGLGCEGYHDNCTDNLAQGMRDTGLQPPETPSPLKLFMNIPWTAAGGLSFDPPVSTRGSFIALRAEID